ncbi:hypothetical protein [Polaribacter sp.]|uniref:hypothetical protein n=1 Tax=Polaribacter sp. TaxID=1920175 RepID=UPI003F6B73C4
MKKIRVKDKELKVPVVKALKDYNFKTKEIELRNADNFKALDLLMSSRIRSRVKSSNANTNPKDNPNDFRQKIIKIIRPVKQEIIENEVVLNKTLATLLSEKQNKKWLKLQKSQKDKLKPQRPQNNNRTLQH